MTLTTRLSRFRWCNFQNIVVKGASSAAGRLAKGWRLTAIRNTPFAIQKARCCVFRRKGRVIGVGSTTAVSRNAPFSSWRAESPTSMRERRVNGGGPRLGRRQVDGSPAVRNRDNSGPARKRPARAVLERGAQDRGEGPLPAELGNGRTRRPGCRRPGNGRRSGPR